ncbi:MAG TPA: Nif3-like dinuclear metal center hexameric protein [Gemmatimonadales bacterium]|nr:Nif3-like dinuclear metal center hexameric protein [Gemmatimonadales bacterium]
MRLEDLVRYLDDYLRTGEVADDPNALNGLQVENAGEVHNVAVAVDACQAVIDQAAERGADLLIVHHGLFWSGLEPLVGRHYRRAASLVRHGIALYSAHLPLDRHPEVGNNVVLARKLGLEVRGWFGEYRGAPLGTWGELDLPRETLATRLGEILGGAVRVIPGGPARVRRVGIITGSAGSMIAQAKRADLDSFVTGEGQHWTYFDAEELGVNAFYAGHYATETLGVRALAEHIAERFQLPWSFVDHPTGL